jgi:CBS domain-containing protein
VVDGRNQLVGMVALQDLKEYLGAGDELRGIIAYDVMRPPPPCVTPNQRLLEVLPVVLGSEQRNIPVVNTLGGGAGHFFRSHRRQPQERRLNPGSTWLGWVSARSPRR